MLRAVDLFCGAERREIPGLPGYWACMDGSVWSSRYGKGGIKKPRLIKAWRRPRGGYLTVSLRAETNGTLRSYYVHRLILLTFVGPAPDGTEACHNDGDTRNNGVFNLRWDLRPANLAERDIAKGQRRPEAKLTENDIREIRKRLETGERQKDIAKDFKVCRQTIGNIKTGSGWSHVR